MITDDEVMDLFERADPARAEDTVPPVDAAAYLDALRAGRNYVSDEATPVALGPTGGARWRIVTSVAVAGVLVLGALVLAASADPDGPTDREPLATEHPENLSNPRALRIAQGFLDAVGTFDAGAAIGYLAEDADLSEMTAPGGVEDVGGGTKREFRLLVALLSAQGYEQAHGPCEVVGDSDGGTIVRCPVAFSSLRSSRYAPGPFDGSHVDLTVRHGAIDRAATRWRAAQFEAQVWRPFATWVTTTHPGDALVMYRDGSRTSAVLTEPSIGLWERHTREYAAGQSAAMIRIAHEFMAARNARDAETALSLTSDDGVSAQLCNQGLTPRYACVVDDPEEPIMGRVRLDRAALTFAFEAEALLGFRFDRPVCEKASGPLVTCSYRMDTRLKRIAGYPPVEAASSLSVVDGHIRLVAFPWLNIGYNPAGFNPVEAEPFMRWLEGEYPEVLGSGDLPSTNGPVFRNQGQELILILTRPSLARLSAYLDEYGASGPLPAGDGSSDTTGRLRRRVAGVSFSLLASPPWAPGPIDRLADADGFRTRRLYVSQSRVGPQGAEAVVYWTSFPPDGNQAAPCEPILGGLHDPSASALAATVAAAPGTRVVEPPTEVTVGERAAVHVRLAVLDDRGCDPGYFYTWRDEGWGSAWTATNPGDTIDVWIVEVAGELLVVVGETTPQAGPELVTQVQQLVHSVRFDP